MSAAASVTDLDGCEDGGRLLSAPRTPGCHQVIPTSRTVRSLGLSNNGMASGDSGLKTAGLPPLAVRMWVGAGGRIL